MILFFCVFFGSSAQTFERVISWNDTLLAACFCLSAQKKCIFFAECNNRDDTFISLEPKTKKKEEARSSLWV